MRDTKKPMENSRPPRMAKPKALDWAVLMITDLREVALLFGRLRRMVRMRRVPLDVDRAFVDEEDEEEAAALLVAGG